nr:MAG TPA: hypothetical protein [Bacteriophage sp.]
MHNIRTDIDIFSEFEIYTLLLNIRTTGVLNRTPKLSYT